MKRALLFAIGLSCAAAGASEWAQEPTEIIGIKLGAPLSLPPCAERRPFDRDWRPPSSLCAVRTGVYDDRVQTLEGLPWNDIGISGSVGLYGGNVSYVMFTVGHDYYQRFKEMLISKYGQPHEIIPKAVTSRAGAVLSSEQLVWKGRDVEIVSLEREGRIDTAVVMVQHVATSHAADKARSNRVESDANKL